MSRNVGVFGGSFDPPHVGHVLALSYVVSTTALDEIVVVPCFVHPFSKNLTSFDRRLRMCDAAFGWLPGVTISTVERDLGGESRTVRTLTALKQRHPDWNLRLIIGSDILRDAPRWYAFDTVKMLAPPLVLPRAGYADSSGDKPVLLPKISSTKIRQMLANRDWEQIQHWVPSRVIAILREQFESTPTLTKKEPT